MKDFEDEVPVYLNTNEVISILNSCDLTGDPFADIHKMYKKLNMNNIVIDDELDSLSAWVKDLEGIL
jgi:hypothetical protein